MKLLAEIAPCIWLEIPHLKEEDLFNHKPSLEKEKLLVQEERVECNHPKAHNHLNSLMALSNLLELMRTMSHQQTSKFIRELLLKKHQQKMFLVVLIYVAQKI